MVKINPSLTFSGVCGDAFRRYAALLGGEIVYMLTYAQSLLVYRRKLVAAQQENDPVAAQEVLQNSFRTDVRALVAEARLRAGGALDPLALYRSEHISKRLIKERGAGKVATGL